MFVCQFVISLVAYFSIFTNQGRECEEEGYWIGDRKGCMRTFAQLKSEEELKELMYPYGFTKKIQERDGKWVFFLDECYIETSKREIIICGESSYSLDNLSSFDDENAQCRAFD